MLGLKLNHVSKRGHWEAMRLSSDDTWIRMLGFDFDPPGQDIFCLKNVDTFMRTTVGESKMNAAFMMMSLNRIISALLALGGESTSDQWVPYRAH